MTAEAGEALVESDLDTEKTSGGFTGQPAKADIVLPYDDLVTLIEERATYRARAGRSTTVLDLTAQAKELEGEVRRRDDWIEWVTGHRWHQRVCQIISGIFLVFFGVSTSQWGFWPSAALLGGAVGFHLSSFLLRPRKPKFDGGVGQAARGNN